MKLNSGMESTDLRAVNILILWLLQLSL